MTEDCFKIVFAMWTYLFACVLIAARLIMADKEIESDSEPCSRDVLRVTTHGVISVNRSCSDNTVSTIDDIANRIVGSLPELSSYTYSVIVCPTTMATSITVGCSYSVYIAETRNSAAISNSLLTRVSMTALQSEFTPVMIVEPDNGGVDLRLLRSADEADDMMMESSGSNYYDTGSSNDRKLKDIHIVIIAVGIFLISCFSLTCLITFICSKCDKSTKLSLVPPPLPISLDEGDCIEMHPLTPPVNKKLNRLSVKEPALPPILTNLLSMQNLKELLDDEDAIETEYSTLSPNTISIEHIPEGTIYKNRYVDILPDPRTRVPLSLQSGVPTSDYINANYIRGYRMADTQYIAAQGPLPETVEDFWRLIWEQRCSRIVMLTNLIENDKIRCHRYWPDGRVNRTSVYGELVITIGKRQTEKDYTITTFMVQHREKAINREITHFWFTSWSDHGVLEITTPLIAFVREVRNHQAEIPGPLLVHCSAGIGRTGVFICCDIGMRELEETNNVDILQIVTMLRQDRGGMIQTSSQYHFVYKLLYDYGCHLQWTSPSHPHEAELENVAVAN